MKHIFKGFSSGVSMSFAIVAFAFAALSPLPLTGFGGAAHANQPSYTGPRQMNLNEANVTGACECGSSIASTATEAGGTSNPLTTALVFAPILSMVIKQVIYDSEGNVEEVIYEDMVAVVEMEKIGNDYYVRFFEMRKEDVTGWIAGRAGPEDIYYMMGAEEFLESQDEGGELNDTLPAGVSVQELQIMEFPPEDTYHYMFFIGPGGEPVVKADFLAMFQ